MLLLALMHAVTLSASPPMTLAPGSGRFDFSPTGSGAPAKPGSSKTVPVWYYLPPDTAADAPIDVPAVQRAIAELRRGTPDIFVIYFVHWGENYQWKNAGQTKIAYALREAGVDLVVGSHAHPMKEIEYDGRGWIVYGVGNFLFNARGRYALNCGILPFSIPLVVDFSMKAGHLQTGLRVYSLFSDNQRTGYQPRFVTAAEFATVEKALVEHGGWQGLVRAAVKGGVDGIGNYLEFLPPSPATHSGSQTPFVKSILAHFSAWDTNHDGQLSPEEIDALMKDPDIHGDAAATVSALKLITRGSKGRLPPLTVEYFEKYNTQVAGILAQETAGDLVDATNAAAGEEGDIPAAKPIGSAAKWDRYFIAGKKRLETAGQGQWSTSKFDLGRVKQGALGDCFFIASLGSVLSHRPERIKKLIQQQPDGSYKATFEGVPTFTVPKLTDAEIAVSSSSGEGAFLAVFEEAYGKYRALIKGGTADVEGTDILTHGGDSAPTLQALTGHDTQRIVFPRTVEARAAARDKVLPKVRLLLIHNMQHHLAITAGGVVGVSARSVRIGERTAVTPQGTLPIDPPDIQRNHVYAIVDYDAKTDRVTFWNPHGETFQPKGEPGLKHGYVTKHGKFTLPLTEAYQFYGSFTFETAAPAKPPAKKTDKTAT